MAVHPRERGEHLETLAMLAAYCGSSPRARGTRCGRCGRRGCRRFIPASAGNTRAVKRAVGSGGGSSPRARGTRRIRELAHVALRFIPASAGNTNGKQASENKKAVHPRERGEHLIILGVGVLPYGSSPRARGTPKAFDASSFVPRFIPASAGNTSPTSDLQVGKAVHPRERGEHRPYASNRRIACGSSPRARGTQCTVMSHVEKPRFIPASAGNTL